MVKHQDNEQNNRVDNYIYSCRAAWLYCPADQPERRQALLEEYLQASECTPAKEPLPEL